MKGVTIFLADGFEDMEALGTRDVLVRGGINVRLASISNNISVCSSHGVNVQADCCINDIKDEDNEPVSQEDIMIFPGGMPGTKNLAACDLLIQLMNNHYKKGGRVAAICAAPGFVLGQLDGIEKATFTCYDGCQDLSVSKGAKYQPDEVVVCGRIITGRGPGYSIKFGLAILNVLRGEETAKKVEYDLMLK